MESYTPMDVFPGDIGLSNDMNETTEYIKYGMENGICKISSKASMLFLTGKRQPADRCFGWRSERILLHL